MQPRHLENLLSELKEVEAHLCMAETDRDAVVSLALSIAKNVPSTETADLAVQLLAAVRQLKKGSSRFAAQDSDVHRRVWRLRLALQTAVATGSVLNRASKTVKK